MTQCNAVSLNISNYQRISSISRGNSKVVDVSTSILDQLYISIPCHFPLYLLKYIFVKCITYTMYFIVYNDNIYSIRFKFGRYNGVRQQFNDANKIKWVTGFDRCQNNLNGTSIFDNQLPLQLQKNLVKNMFIYS